MARSRGLASQLYRLARLSATGLQFGRYAHGNGGHETPRHRPDDAKFALGF
jgi:hypothetical protein